MDSENTTSLTAMVKCCECECSCGSVANKSLWLRSVKRKLDECDDEVDEKFVIPGLIIPQTARIEMVNECAALREMVSTQQDTIQDLSLELEEERNAAASAANEAMSMILRLQREKAESQMEFRQFKMFTEEKMAHDQEEIMALEDFLYKREQAIQSLSCEVQMYKHRMLSYGLLESDVEDDKGQLSIMGESIDGHFEYDYPPLKCTTINENQVNTEVDNEVVDVEKYAFGESPQSCDRFHGLEQRIGQLEEVPRSSQTEVDVLEKAIVAQSSIVTNEEISSDSNSLSPKLGGKVIKAENSLTGVNSNLREVNEPSEVGDEMSDRVYTIDCIQQGAAGYNGTSEPKATPNHADFGDPEITKLYLRLQALEADRESMRQSIISMRTEKAQMILLKQIAQQLCKEMTPSRRTPVRRLSVITSFSFLSIFKWILSFLLWRKKARRCKYLFGLSANRAGLLILLDKGPRVGQWRCLSSTQV